MSQPMKEIMADVEKAKIILRKGIKPDPRKVPLDSKLKALTPYDNRIVAANKAADWKRRYS